MIDLRTKLQASHNLYTISHHDNCTLIQPRESFVNREPPTQEYVASTFLRTDRYSISWRISCSQMDMLQRCDVLVFIDNLRAPSLMYDARKYPEYSVAFHLKQSKYIYVLLRVQGKATVSLQTLHIMLARDVVVGHDPLMYEWDMVKVASALMEQRLIRKSLTQLHILFDWKTVQDKLGIWLKCWKEVFATDRSPVVDHYANTVLQCRWQAPNVLMTSRESLIGTFECDTHGQWHVKLRGQLIAPTYVHPQYYIWCFPDKQIKIALRKDVPVIPNKVEFTLQGNDTPKTPIWYWLGYNFIGNSPFYNIWSINTHKLEFINREDILSMFDEIEDHFEANELQPETNLYK